MTSGLKAQDHRVTKLANPQSGYILITLMLFVALLSIAALAVLPQVKQQIKRDREEEMIHRGTEYMRAIQHFYKKNNRYPTRIEDLENTNNVRYLRRRYKDPTIRDPETHKEKDFKLLHMGDVNLYTGQPGGGIPGLNGPANGPANALPNGPGVSTGLGGAKTGGSTDTPDAGDDDEGPVNQKGTPGGSGTLAGSPLQSNQGGGNTVFGGGPILGVASTNKDKSVREFGDKYKHYKDWLFVFDPTANAGRGGLLKGPVVPDSNQKGGIGGVSVDQMNKKPGSNPPQTQPQESPEN